MGRTMAFQLKNKGETWVSEPRGHIGREKKCVCVGGGPAGDGPATTRCVWEGVAPTAHDSGGGGRLLAAR
jgi:hypothetical protein